MSAIDCGRQRLNRLPKNPDFTPVLKERGFEPRRKCRIITRGFSRWGELLARETVFLRPVKPHLGRFEGARLNSQRKNSDFAPVLKGRGFEPRRKCRIITRGF
jgi:hypothetical protein